MKILIIKLSAIGDVIHTLPALNAIRNCLPSAHITWLIEETAADLIINHTALDRVIVSKRKLWIKELFSASFFTGLKNIFKFSKKLRDTKYDIIIDFQALLKSGIMVMLAKGKRKAGFNKGMQHMEHSYIFLNDRVPPVDMEIHALTRGILLLQALGIIPNSTMSNSNSGTDRNRENNTNNINLNSFKTGKIEYNLPVSKNNRLEIDRLLKKHNIDNNKILIALNPEATWITKLWSNKKFAQLADCLMDIYDAQIVFTGGKCDKATVKQIQSEIRKKTVDFTGKTTLKTLVALYERTDLLVTTDTGPMHLAVAAGTKVVAIFGPTAPWRTGPFGQEHHVVRTGIHCSPCFKRECETMECMKQISVNNVLKKIQEININIK